MTCHNGDRSICVRMMQDGQFKVYRFREIERERIGEREDKRALLSFAAL